MSYGMLIDETKCVGCRACQVACKQWNDLPAEQTRNTGSYTNPPRLSGKTWNLIEYVEANNNGKVGFYFLKRACMHCEHPACASVCPVGALHKTPAGPVIYDAHKCIGCRYCMAACPFGIPSFDWDKGLLNQPVISKCTMCFDRVSNGLEPACAKTCVADAILFGEREDLLREAEARISKNPERYINHIYGKDEAGGTSILYLSSIPFAQLGLPQVINQPVTAQSEKVMSYTIPFATAWLATLAGLAAVVRLRERGQSKKDVVSSHGKEKSS